MTTVDISQTWPCIFTFFIFKAKLWMFFSFNVFWGVIWRVNVYFTLLKQHSCGWFHPMKAVLMCITDYCMYLHMQHMNMDTDMTDIYIICLYLWICLSFKIQLFKVNKIDVLCQQIYGPTSMWNIQKMRHHVVKLFSTAHIVLLV